MTPCARRQCGRAGSLGAWQGAFGVCLLAVLVLAFVPKEVPMPCTGWGKSNQLLAFSMLPLFPGLFAYGVLIEVMQSFAPNRPAEWHDVVADAAGVGLGWAAGWLVRTWCRRRLLKPAHPAD